MTIRDKSANPKTVVDKLKIQYFDKEIVTEVSRPSHWQIRNDAACYMRFTDKAKVGRCVRGIADMFKVQVVNKRVVWVGSPLQGDNTPVLGYPRWP